MSTYEIVLLGDVSSDEQKTLLSTISSLIREFDLVLDQDVTVRDANSFGARDLHASAVVAYFGSSLRTDQDLARAASKSSLPIIPTIPATGEFALLIPDFLQPLNGLRRRDDDPKMIELATALLECLGLLRRQRRVFVSYRRAESRGVAVQLHDLLSARGFDVFLDTHDIRPGEQFQDVLWHRLCDSDVMVMLDTPKYFESKWTRQELGRARAKEIHVLRIVWPDHRPTSHTDLAETIYLEKADLSDGDRHVSDSVADKIAIAIEGLRSRSIAARYLSITGKLRAEVLKIGGRLNGIGRHRAIAIELPNGPKVWAYPIVGIPSAELLNDVAKKAQTANQNETPILIYDHIGIGAPWISHLEWLDEQIKVVRAMRVAEAGWTLAAWGD